MSLTFGLARGHALPAVLPDLTTYTPPLKITINVTMFELPCFDLLQVEARNSKGWKIACGRNTTDGTAELIIPFDEATDLYQFIAFGLDGTAAGFVSGSPANLRLDGETYLIELAGSSEEPPAAGTIAGTLQVDGNPEARPLIAISAKPIGASQQYRYLGATESDPLDGSYSMGVAALTDCILIALDNYGDEWQASTNYSIDDVMHPPVSNGFYYICISAGNSGAVEPIWWADSGNNTQGAVGGATFAAHAYYRPLAHGPLTPVPV